MLVKEKCLTLLGHFLSLNDAPLVRLVNKPWDNVQGLGQIGILCAVSAQPVEPFLPGM